MRTIAKSTALLLVALTTTTAFAQHSDRQARADTDTVQRRQELLQMSKDTIADLRKDDVANKLYRDSYGNAVFDATKGGFFVTGAGGTGVAMKKTGGEPVFMRMGGAGVGLGAGIENYKLVILFQNKDAYDKFVTGAWGAGLSAQAAAGHEGKGDVGKFANGIAVYHMNDKGLIAQVDATGVKFWPADSLNPGPG